MHEPIPDTAPVKGIIALETVRAAFADAIDRKGAGEAAFLASRRDGTPRWTVVGIETDEDDDVVLLFDSKGPARLDETSYRLDGLTQDGRGFDAVFVKHARLGVIAGALVGASPDRDGDLTLEFDFIDDVLSELADELAELDAA